MASSRNLISILVAILIVGTGMVSAARILEETLYVPSSLTVDVEDAAPTSDEVKKHVLKCAEKFSDRCGKEVYDAIFYYANIHKSISLYCCQNLVQAGLECHNELVNAIASTPEFAPNKHNIILRSSDVWSDCVEGAQELAHSPH